MVVGETDVGGGTDGGEEVLEGTGGHDSFLEDVQLVAGDRQHDSITRTLAGVGVVVGLGRVDPGDRDEGRQRQAHLLWSTVDVPRVRPRCSSRFTRWCTTEVESRSPCPDR